MSPAAADPLVVDINYACFGRALHRPATPPDAYVIAAFKLILAGVVLLPLVAGLVVILPLLAGIEPHWLLPWPP